MTDLGLGTQDIERHMAPATSAHNKPLSRDTSTKDLLVFHHDYLMLSHKSRTEMIQRRSAITIITWPFISTYLWQKYEV